MALHWADWLIFAVFLAASIGIGIYYALSGGRQRTTKEFIMADRNLKVIPTMLSLLVSYQSAIMIIGHVSEMYTRSSQAWLWECIGVTISIFLAERIFVPFLYPLKLTSVNEYFLLRFESHIVSILGCALSVGYAVLYMGTAMFAPSIALQAVSGLPVVGSIPLMAVICVTYTALGGMKAVVWTDVLQFGVMFGGIVALVISGSMQVGGFGHVLDECDKGGRLMWADVSPDPTVRHTVWGFLFGLGTIWIYSYGLQQASVQRYSALPTLRQARLSLLLNIPILLVMITMVCILGLTIFAYYSDIGCDPLASRQIFSSNQLLTLFMNRIFAKAPGLAGLFLATLFSGALSSVSSSLSAAAANTWEDILKWKLQSRVSEERAAQINRVLVVVFGIIATGLSFLAASIDAPVTQVSVALMGSVSGPLTGMFLLGGIFRVGNWKGAVAGAIIGITFNFWVNIGALFVAGRHNPPLPPASIANCTFNITLPTRDPLPPVTGIEKLYTLSYVYYTLFGAIITLVVGLLTSLITKESHEKIYSRPNRLFIHLNQFFSCDSEDSTEEQDKYPSQSDYYNTHPSGNMEKKDHDNPAFTPLPGQQLEKSAASNTTSSTFVVSAEDIVTHL